MNFEPRAFFLRFVTAMNEHDFETVDSLIHPEFVSDSPQSGERSRGFAMFAAQLRDYPGSSEIVPQLAHAQVIGEHERRAITPGYTVVPLASPNEYTTVTRTQYPDGSWWWVIALVEMRDDKLYRLENYFAPEMPAPLAESIAAAAHG